MTVEENNERLERVLLDSMEGELGTKSPEESIDNYWKLIDSVRKTISNLVGDLLQAKLLLVECSQSAEVAERPDEEGNWMVCCHTGKRTMTIEWIDLESQAAYEKWKAESDHKPVIVETAEIWEW